MNALIPPDNSLPWSKLVEAGWTIAHIHHTHLAGKRSLIAMMRKGTDVILEQGEDDLTVFRKLEVKAGIEKRQAVAKPDKAPADPRHKAFLDLWFARHQDFFGRPYAMNGGKDGAQLARFLKTMTRITPMEIMDVAERAWEKQEVDPFAKESKQSTTVTGLVTCWNGICAELDRAKQQQQSANGSTFRL